MIRRWITRAKAAAGSANGFGQAENPPAVKTVASAGQSNHFGGRYNVLGAASAACGTRYDSERLLLKTLARHYRFDTVADLGCGPARMLRAARELGASTVRGFDIGEIPIEKREISAEEFTEVDLTRPLAHEQRYDLVISTEVAEHLPEKFADQFVDNLCGIGDVILFSAAIPGQGGMNHVNEQWVEYWAEKFEERGLLCFDLFRPALWNEPRVEYFYRQNCLLWVKARASKHFFDQGLEPVSAVSRVHPELFLKASYRGKPSSGSLFEAVADYYRHAFRR